MVTRPRLLLGSLEVPAVGGSSTASYDLFRRMHHDGVDAHYVNLVDENDVPFYHLMFGGDVGNPRALPNVRNCWLHGRFDDPHPELARLITTLDPEVMVGFGYLATQLLAGAAPDRRTVFVTGTCRQAQDYVTSGRARDAVSLARALRGGTIQPRVVNNGERRAVAQCDLMVTHSALTQEMAGRFFPSWAGKIYPNVISFGEWACDGAMLWRTLARPFEERDIDVLFVASDWSRPEKNYSLVRTITRTLGNARIHVVGHVPHALPSVTHHGFMGSREALFGLFGRARSVACPSLMDAAPGVLFEGSVMGCNVVASKNCGNWELCNAELLVDPFSPAAFAAGIRRAMSRKHADNLERLLQRRCYDELLGLLTAFAQPFGARTV
jgi:glycosyltransferase involved in cell wall biosynthesis